MNDQDKKTVRCVCPLDCPDTCSMLVTVENGKAVSLRGNPDHSFTRGALCGKMNHYLEVVYSGKRLRTPLKRVGRKGAGEFVEISWEEALDTIADRFRRIANGPDGPQAILPYSYYGTMGKLQAASLDRRFFHRLGASMLDRTICASAGVAGYEYTVGACRFGADPLAATGCRLILNWGSNTVQTNTHLWSLMVEARKSNGARIVTIDPYRSETAQRSDQHLQIRPGTDAALALGMMHVIFARGLQDADYLNRFCVGGEELARHVTENYPVSKVAAITGLSETEIEELAVSIATVQPCLIRLNYGLQRHFGGGMAVRTIACLPAVTGAWRYPGGGTLLTTSGTYDFDADALTRPDLVPPGTRTVNMNQLAEALAGELEGPPVQALYVYNCNPAAVAPNQAKVVEGLRRDDLFNVVHELFATDTVDYADIVLPATSQLEHEDLHSSYGHFEVMHNERAIEPLFDSKSNVEVFRALASKLGFEPDLFPDDATLMRSALNGGPLVSGITLETLRQKHSIRMDLPETFMPYAEGGFRTPSGKCELYSERMIVNGLPPLPEYSPAAESPFEIPVSKRRYPIMLLSPPKGSFLNSTFGDSDFHLGRAGDPSVEMNEADAATAELAAGEWAMVENDRGKFLARVLLNGSVSKGVACARGIHWSKTSPGGYGINATTSSGLTDMGGGAVFFDNAVRIRRPKADEIPDSLRLENAQ
jgi:anaerobic selenocysteine-containing dehydrogenase